MSVVCGPESGVVAQGSILNPAAFRAASRVVGPAGMLATRTWPNNAGRISTKGNGKTAGLKANPALQDLPKK